MVLFKSKLSLLLLWCGGKILVVGRTGHPVMTHFSRVGSTYQMSFEDMICI